MNNETDVERVVIKNYFNGAELDIVDLLNGVYGRWGDVEKWRHAYPDYPTFERDDVVMIEKDGRLVGHGGLHARTLEVKQGERVLAALLGDAAVREDHRGRGIYSKIVEKRLDIAKSRGAAFAFWWVLRDSVSYRTGKKFGFIEVNQTPVYIKILKPKKILEAALADLLQKNPGLKTALQQIEVDICLCVMDKEIHLKDLLGENIKKEKPMARADVSLDEMSLSTLVNFRNMSRFQRVLNMLHLILSRKVKIKLHSIAALPRMTRATLNFVRVL